MLEHTRRAFLLGISATAGCALCGAPARARGIVTAGCFVKAHSVAEVAARQKQRSDVLNKRGDGKSSQGGDMRTPVGGSVERDRIFERALARVSDILRVAPGFSFYDDYDGMNAFATSETTLSEEGSVFFGTRLFELLMTEDPSGAAVMYVVAHEYAHIKQFQAKLIEPLAAGRRTVKRAELHADYMAGYYLGVRKLDQPTLSLRPAGAQVWSFGDTAVDSPSHHGTPRERLDAAERGFLAAYEARMNVDRAFQAGYDYALTTPPPRRGG